MTVKTAKPKEAKIAGNPNPNKDLPLQNINYAALRGQSFTDYQSVVGDLFLNDKYDFEMWLATSEVEYVEDRTSPVNKKVPVMVGIKLWGQEPIQRTRIKLKDALELNKQISHVQGDRQNSKYFLLAKPKAE